MTARPVSKPLAPTKRSIHPYSRIVMKLPRPNNVNQLRVFTYLLLR